MGPEWEDRVMGQVLSGGSHWVGMLVEVVEDVGERAVEGRV
jgi:hypothetical protein